MKKVTIIQSSLREDSNTAILCNVVQKKLDEKVSVSCIDLRNLDLQFCDARRLEEYNSDMQKVYQELQESEIILIGMPVYNYTFSGVLKNFLDITVHALKEKRIGVLINAGGPNCFMAGADLMNALFYEVGARSISPNVYTWSVNFENGELKDERVLRKIDELVEKIIL